MGGTQPETLPDAGENQYHFKHGEVIADTRSRPGAEREVSHCGQAFDQIVLEALRTKLEGFLEIGRIDVQRIRTDHQGVAYLQLNRTDRDRFDGCSRS